MLDEEIIEALREVEGGDLETEVVQHVFPLLTELLGSSTLLNSLQEELNDVFGDNSLKQVMRHYYIFERGG